MTSLTRWDPFADLSTTMDRLFEEGFGRPWRLWRGGVEETGWFPVEVSETDNEIEVKASLPGVKPEDIDISVHDDMLMIKGETRQEAEEKRKSYYRQELRYGSMQRAITLPTRIETERAQATYEDGILRLKLPKSEQARPRQIKIQAGGGRQTIEAAPSESQTNR